MPVDVRVPSADTAGVVDHRVIGAVRDQLAELGNPDRAPQMQRYMRSELPYRGVSLPACRRLARQLGREHPQPDVAALTATVRELWHGARFREERYVALTLTGDRRYAAWQTPALLPLYEELIVTGAWWDLVDDLATHRVGPLLRAFPDELTPVLRAWAVDADRWKRRTSVICQVGAKTATDTALLSHCIEANIADRDFFLRKAIGWALRDFSKVDPGWVAAFVSAHPDLSPLSRREASKYLPG